MFNFFEQPWTLLGAAVIVLFGVLTFRSVWPEKCKWWQWLIPVALACLALSLDYLVQTDRERINSVIDAVISAVEREDCATVEQLIAPDYHDSYHRDKADLIRHCRRSLSQSLIAKNIERNRLVLISGRNATVTVFTTTHFEANSWVARDYKSFFFFKGRLDLKKQSDGRWLITSITPITVDKQPARWSDLE